MKKKMIAWILAAALCAGLAGCGGAQSTAEAPAAVPEEESAAEETEGLAEEELEDAASSQALASADGEMLDDPGEVQGMETSLKEIGGDDTMNGVSFVLIYNPNLYHEEDSIWSMLHFRNTGDFQSQILTGMRRADTVSDIEVPAVLSQGTIDGDIELDDYEREGAKAGGLDPVYSLGDEHEFYCGVDDINSRTPASFTCVYEGEHCYVWSLDNSAISDADAEEMGQEFDDVIYEKDVEAFGPGRFTENGGKVNMLFYDMPSQYGGFFCMYDIFAGTEATEAQKASYGLNTDHAIIHINAARVQDSPDFVKSTLAHEFQHLICASDYFYYAGTPKMRTWLNEAMSAYAEEMVYPGIKEAGYYNQFMYLSDNFRTGQSLYNFDTMWDDYIGAYGAVYLFSQYLAQNAGEDVFSKIHEFWRTSYSADINEAMAIAKAVPDDFYRRIDEEYKYPSSLSASFESAEDEWMSKLTLDFFITTLSTELAGLQQYNDQVHAIMLYTQVNPQDIQGGGRMIVATGNGSYDIPDDAGEDLMYIGLNDDFEIVTDLVIR